jgi:hypothetical protein
MTDKLKIEISVPNFFFIPMREVEIESVPATGRTYFLKDRRIIAVATRSSEKAS